MEYSINNCWFIGQNSIHRYFLESAKKDFSQFRSWPLIPIFCSLWSRIAWSTLSNALLKSRYSIEVLIILKVGCEPFNMGKQLAQARSSWPKSCWNECISFCLENRFAFYSLLFFRKSLTWLMWGQQVCSFMVLLDRLIWRSGLCDLSLKLMECFLIWSCFVKMIFKGMGFTHFEEYCWQSIWFSSKGSVNGVNYANYIFLCKDNLFKKGSFLCLVWVQKTVVWFWGVNTEQYWFWRMSAVSSELEVIFFCCYIF